MIRTRLLCAAVLPVLAATLAACTSAPVAQPLPPAPTSEPPSAVAPQEPVPSPPTATGNCVNTRDIPRPQQLAQLLMVSVDSSGTEQARNAVAQGVGGVFVGGDANGLLTSGALPKIGAGTPLGVMVAVDEEGGRVQRIDELNGRLPSARAMVQAGKTEAQVRQLARDRGAALRGYGVTVDFAPDVDVSDQPNNAVIGDRSFSADPAIVTKYARAFAQGLRDAGVLPVLKHFPGHGESSGDSHEGPVSVPPLNELKGRDLLPFRDLIAESSPQEPVAVMVGHLDVPGLTEPGVPASLSPKALALLRRGTGYGAKGFDGVVFSDDLAGMAAITDKYDLPTAVLDTLKAGSDIALFTTASRVPAVLTTLERAVNDGDLPEAQVQESLRRVLEAKGITVCG